MVSTLTQTTCRKNTCCCFCPCARQLAPWMPLCVESLKFFHNAASKSSQDFWNATYRVIWGNGGIILEKNLNTASKKHEEFQLYQVCFLNIWYTTISTHTLIFNMKAQKIRVARTYSSQSHSIIALQQNNDISKRKWTLQCQIQPQWWYP